ncbi:MAG: hypothetical protein IKM49_02175, partial [Ruminococcus sp.]|nr:hypothetical protein [Ruminococcus sp.]
VHIIDSAIYCFTADGVMHTGWYTEGSSKYYFGEDGKAVTGWQTIDGKGYYFNSVGIALTGWQTLATLKYYFDAEGVKQLGWQTIDGNLYHFDETTGVMSVNTNIDGYEIGADGIATKLSEVQKRADVILSSIGTGADDIYNYVRSNNKYKYMETTRTLAQIESVGWSFFADYAMDNRFVVCYYFAAITDVLFKQAGYETRIVYGTGRGTGDHYWNQVLINGVWTNYDTCNGYANVTDDYLKDQNYTWTQFVYPEYN